MIMLKMENMNDTHIPRMFKTIAIAKYISPFFTSPAYAIPRPVKRKDIMIAMAIFF